MEVNERLARIEAKLDAILDALDGDEADEPQTNVVTTMDGQRFEVPAEGESL